VARDDSQFDGLQLVGTQKVGRISEATAFCGVRPRDSCPLGDRTLPAGGTRDAALGAMRPRRSSMKSFGMIALHFRWESEAGASRRGIGC
jgi:hypothetical protein